MMIARSFASDSSLFTETMVSTYLNEVSKVFDSHAVQDIECGLTAIFLICKQKKVLDQLSNKPELLMKWLNCGKSVISEIKVAFLVSLDGLLERTSDSDGYAKFIHKILCHVLNPEQLAEEGNLKEFLGMGCKGRIPSRLNSEIFDITQAKK